MASLSDMAAGVTSGNDRSAYLAYAEACMMAGKQPLTMPAWVAAGKPAGP